MCAYGFNRIVRHVVIEGITEGILISPYAEN